MTDIKLNGSLGCLLPFCTDRSWILFSLHVILALWLWIWNLYVCPHIIGHAHKQLHMLSSYWFHHSKIHWLTLSMSFVKRFARTVIVIRICSMCCSQQFWPGPPMNPIYPFYFAAELCWASKSIRFQNVPSNHQDVNCWEIQRAQLEMFVKNPMNVFGFHAKASNRIDWTFSTDIVYVYRLTAGNAFVLLVHISEIEMQLNQLRPPKMRAAKLNVD